MSLVNKIRDLYEQNPRRKVSTGLPTGSRLGTCAAQLQMLRYPQRYPAELPRPRMLMTWDQGNRIEKWLGETLRQCWPGLVGLEQEPFHFLVEIEAGRDMDTIRDKILGRTLWGTLEDGFQPPHIALGDDGRVKMRLASRKKLGFVLDRKAGGVWVPTYVDFVLLHEEFGLSVVECKSMSNFSFRRAILGELDYGKRAQMLGIRRATGASVIGFFYRNETGHTAEVAYTGTTEHVKVTLTKPNGAQEIYRVTTDRTKLVNAAGEPVAFPADTMWDTAQTWTPLDEGLWTEVRTRLIRVLTFDGEPATLVREHGPEFSCAVCQGTGIQTLRKGGSVPLKEPKPCVDCVGGMKDEAELPSFPCGYCPVTEACWQAASPRFEIDDRPHWYVKRSDYQQSGLTVQRPAGWS